MKYGFYNDHFQNYKVYGIPKAQLVIADIPYNVGANAYGCCTDIFGAVRYMEADGFCSKGERKGE